ncbi:Afadin and alpha-actinin-binding-domain-containing protein [Aspergillus cavernicola]|uniref:Afadin and alpha-actinin-binding-domain-containing protein n=1 Tax=Aspergillus cavernicola TaxID=176166 RepID=A0ABR4IAK5_9EURO
MEPQGDLQAASTYINNVLLARGLVKSGRPIDFANPEDEEGGVAATMARIINLVNDLVLRRDREAEHRENLATTIRTIRAEDSHKTVEITAELSRSLALAEAQERALKTNVSSTEATIRGFKDQVQRMKTTVQQVRAQCANDVRKRDLELQKLKAHLADRQRGKREGLGVTTININPSASQSRTRYLSGGEGVHDPGYSLKQETNEFLTQLCQTLSDENDSLILLARNTVQTLNELQGLSSVEDTAAEDGYSHGTASTGPQRSTHGGPAVTSLPDSCEELSSQMDQVLEHLRTLLTNPSFVPLEEVEVRDEEIKRLRDGWEKMESRWRQAVTMMDGWHKRIAHGGGSIRAEELRMGLKLDIQVDSRHSRVRDNDVAMHSPIFEDQEGEENEEDEEEVAEPASSHEDITAPSEEQPQSSPSRALKERSDNIVSASRPPRKEVAFSEGVRKSPSERQQEDDTMPIKAHQSDAVTRRPSRKRVEPKGPRPAPTRMSVHQKLAAAESEARAAEQTRREQESRKRSRGGKMARKRTGDRRRSTLTTDELGELLGMNIFRVRRIYVMIMPETFTGWVAHDPTNPLTHTTFTPKPFEETDMEVQISHCGICGSDIHTIRSGWAPADYPCVVGHEIIGTATRIGTKVTPTPDGKKINPGDRVGIGAQCSSCLRPDCEACADNEESYCPQTVGTYNSRFPDGSKAYGGYANRWRGPGHFVFTIPDELSSAEAAPLLCGGVTVFAPLRRFGAGPGKTVGIIGIGGLGHMGLLFARAMGCDSVVAISRSSAKQEDATGPKGLGADTFIATGEDKTWAKKHTRSLDLIICTVSGENMPLSGYLRLLKRNGVFVQVGAPEDPLPALRAFSLIQKGVKVTGSNIGSPEDIRAMLKLAAEKGVKPWVQTRPMEEVNVALAEMHEGKARYRYVLENGKVGKL